MKYLLSITTTWVIGLVFFSSLFARCEKEPTPIVLLSKFVCSCEQLDHVENFVTQNVGLRDSLSPQIISQLRTTGVALICYRRIMECDAISEEPLWHMEVNQLDSCEVYQF